ncbi:MAG: Gfo/Idh/MocA family oxidoreductase, partial [Blastocatellia bacterium]|nr:Gfo/Idh/MocA family oxidoreductase [Blastocatellia bacterium]
MSTEFGFGLAGCGLIGKVQAEAIGSIPGARLLAVYARDGGRTAEFAARFAAKAYTDYDEFLKHPGLRVITIC